MTRSQNTAPELVARTGSVTYSTPNRGIFGWPSPPPFCCLANNAIFHRAGPVDRLLGSGPGWNCSGARVYAIRDVQLRECAGLEESLRLPLTETYESKEACAIRRLSSVSKRVGIGYFGLRRDVSSTINASLKKKFVFLFGCTNCSSTTSRQTETASELPRRSDS
jgi:hypothetical protein